MTDENVAREPLAWPASPQPSEEFNPEMLRIARGSQGVTQSDLAEKLSISQSKVAKWEDAILIPTEDDLDVIAEKLHYPVEFFYRSDRVHGFGTCCLYHRKRQALSAKLLGKIHDRINVLAMGVSRLLKNVSFDPPGTFPQFDPDEYGTPENVARALRSAWGMPLGPVKNLLEMIENWGGIVVPCDFETGKLDAVSLWPTKLPPLFFVNKQQPADRMRWTLAHELGHIVMHRIPPPPDIAEQQADTFAREFLLPQREIAADMENISLAKALRLKPKWRVSMQAIIHCAKQHDAISARKHQWLFTQISQLGYRKSEPNPITPEFPRLLKRLIDVHLDDLKYSQQSVARVAYCESWDQFVRRFPVFEEGKLRVVRADEAS